MGVRERRERERTELHQAIVRAAREIVEQEGWPAVTIRRVAERVEYSPPVIYEHFSSKELLLFELVRGVFAEMLADMRAARDAAGDPDEAVAAIGVAYWNFATRHPQLHKGIAGHSGIDMAELCRAVAPVRESAALDVRSMHEELFKSGRIPDCDPFPEGAEIFLLCREAIARALGVREDCETLSWRVAVLWSFTHGLISLTEQGLLPLDHDRGVALIRETGRGLLAAWRGSPAPRE